MEWYHYVIAIVGGFLAGVINTFAGNGSAITLTILTEVLGLSPNMANGSNRIGVLAQGTLGTYGFYKNGKLKIAHSKLYIIYTFIGAIIGVLIAIRVSNEQFRDVMSYLMVLMLFVIIVKPKRWLKETDKDFKLHPILSFFLFIGIGIYGGFIQMGMGVFFLIIMVLIAKVNIMESNAVKIFVVSLYTIVVLGIFAYKGLVDWKMGGIVAIGQGIGGYLAAQFGSTYKNANIWAYRLLIVVVIGAIIKLFDLHKLLF